MNLNELFASIRTENKVLVLTANDGLARTLHQSYGAFQKQNVSQAWPRPHIYSINGYAKQFLMKQPTVRRRLVLSPEQSEIVWANCIEASTKDMLLDARTTAKLVRAAESLWHDYGLDDSDFDDWQTEEVQLFLHWRRLFWEKMEQSQWWPAEFAIALTVETFAKGAVFDFTEVVLAGFEELTPLQARLFDILEERGATISRLTSSRVPAIPQLKSLPTFMDELDAAAAWAQSKLQQSPHAQLGIVMPGLEVLREQVHHRLGSMMATEAFLGANADAHIPFHLSLGRPLQQWAPVHHLILFWRLLHKRISHEQVEILFGSPFMWGAPSTNARQQFLRKLNKKRFTHVSAANCRFEMELGEETSEPPSPWEASFLNVSNEMASLEPLALPSVWVERLARWTDHVGWLSGSGISSTLYQLKEAMGSALEKLARLDVVLSEVNFGHFLGHLERSWMAETFQPESENENVRVVGMLEAMGQNFDAVWLCRMNEGIWPASGQPNPFIPHPLQREKQMPHASVQREVEFGHLALQRLLQSAPEVTISFSQQEGDIPLQSSPLLAPWLSSVQTEVSRPNPWGQRIVEQMQQDHFQDWQGLPFDGEQLRGGTSLFQNQVQCPFKAYVLNRLRANTPEEAQPAVAADQHGRLLHHALALFWEDIQSQTNLLALSDQDLREKINASVDAASSQLGHALINASKIFVEVEKKRIAKHMAEWLENEKNRPPFQVVSIEHKREVTFADKKFNMIVDRVDRLENDAHLCIDYKTGKSMKGGDLVKAPLEQAQLPLYALTFEPTPQAVAYGILNVEVNELSGVGAKETASKAGFSNGTPKGMQETWDEQMTVWREQLTETLEKYLKGEAQRAPLSSKVCTYCAARPVCRKDETIALTPKGDHHG